MLRVRTLTTPLLLALLALGHPARADEGDLVISVYQDTCREGDFAANLAAVRQGVAQARERGSHFVAFPECFLSGYESPEALERGARPLDDSDLAAFIAESSAHDMVILVGLARKTPEGVYNSELVIHRGKLLGIYDKVMLTGGDRNTLGFKPGQAVPVFFAHGIRFAVIICHDSSFPHVAMAAKLQGAAVLFSPHNNEISAMVADDHRRWVRNCHVGLACQMKMVVARANIVKSDRSGQIGYGDSFILGPQGLPLAEARLFRDEIITATIPAAMLRSPYSWASLRETPAWLRRELASQLTDFREPTSDDDLRYWLGNMAVDHGYAREEISDATGLTLEEIADALRRFDLVGKTPSPRQTGEPLRIRPYPGGRHPRLGFLEGAVRPHRETKVSVFTPWDDLSYVVVDVPEAIFSNLGLLYLAHTHVPSIWDQQRVNLPRLEWNRHDDGSLDIERSLPNRITFGARVSPTLSAIHMELWLRNDTDRPLTGLRVQNCVLLARAAGFAQQTNDNKLFQSPYSAAHSEDGRRWVITAWEPTQRCWGNDRCPCLHSDPQFPDCPPGATVRLRGWLSFYEGHDIESELERLNGVGWRD